MPVRAFVYERNILKRFVEYLEDLISDDGVSSISVVGDIRTHQIAGSQICQRLRLRQYQINSIEIADVKDQSPVCDEKTVHGLMDQLRSAESDLVIAVGSGVINDLCKWSCFELGIPYVVFATAASMNGYAAANVAAKVEGVKILIKAKAPIAVFADAEIIENAPFEMTAAGFGDIIARFQSQTDWVLNNFLFGEYYCGYCAEMIKQLEPYYLEHPEKLQDRDSEAIRALFASLFYSGIAMTLVGTSAPASGGEHLFSHTLDMMTELDAKQHDLHGRQVGLGVLFSAVLYEKILKIDQPIIRSMPASIDLSFWSKSSIAQAVNKQYELKKSHLQTVYDKLEQPALWSELKHKLRSLAVSPEKIRTYLVQSGSAVTLKDIGCSKTRALDALLHMHQIRQRFTVIDLAWILGILPDAAESIITHWFIDQSFDVENDL